MEPERLLPCSKGPAIANVKQDIWACRGTQIKQHCRKSINQGQTGSYKAFCSLCVVQSFWIASTVF
jgi:hypothetical protein